MKNNFIAASLAFFKPMRYAFAICAVAVVIICVAVSCTVAPTIVPLPSVDEAMAAVIRSEPAAKKVCYDSGLDGYFIYYNPLPPAAEDDNYFHGWVLLQKVNFLQSANKLWFTGDQSFSHYQQVYPDIAGLPCKDQ